MHNFILFNYFQRIEDIDISRNKWRISSSRGNSRFLNNVQIVLATRSIPSLQFLLRLIRLIFCQAILEWFPDCKAVAKSSNIFSPHFHSFPRGFLVSFICLDISNAAAHSFSELFKNFFPLLPPASSYPLVNETIFPK